MKVCVINGYCVALRLKSNFITTSVSLACFFLLLLSAAVAKKHLMPRPDLN